MKIAQNTVVEFSYELEVDGLKAAVCIAASALRSAYLAAFFSWMFVTSVKESCQMDAIKRRIATNLIAPLLCIIIVIV